MYPPNFYTDDDWNDLTDKERALSLSHEYPESYIERRLSELEQEMADVVIRGSDDYEEYRILSREYDALMHMLINNQEQG